MRSWKTADDFARLVLWEKALLEAGRSFFIGGQDTEMFGWELSAIVDWQPTARAHLFWFGDVMILCMFGALPGVLVWTKRG